MAASKKSTGTIPARQEIRLDELEAIVERTTKGSLGESDHGRLKAAVDTLGFLTQELENKNASIARLRKYLFGAQTEKTKQLFSEQAGDGAATGSPQQESEEGRKSGSSKASKPKAKGHGRIGADDYTGATRVVLPHETLESGAACPACPRGKLYPMKQPAVLVRITGMAPLTATVYERAKLRCNLCGEVLTAREPPGVGAEKYDEGAASMIALLKYGTGMPFNRLEQLQKGFGIPLPASTQWELVAAAAEKLLPAYQELVRQAAQGEVIYNDDTTIQILELTGKRRERAIEAGDIDPEQRVGLFTSGIVSQRGEREIVLFFTGSQHAGENLADVLKQREPGLAAPIQMCDALSHNTCGEFDSILSHCLTHARRQFVEVTANFPDECRLVIETLREVYKTDAEARTGGLSKERRLELHQEQSAPRMKELEEWLEKQLSEHLVEPNSGLGKAIRYTRKHWKPLTLFLRVAGAPLDNNICERALKKVIMHRKNAYFFKTRKGARVGDLFMSLIYTAERGGVSPFDYLNALQRHVETVAQDPLKWMPWNYAETVAEITRHADGAD